MHTLENTNANILHSGAQNIDLSEAALENASLFKDEGKNRMYLFANKEKHLAALPVPLNPAQKIPPHTHFWLSMHQNFISIVLQDLESPCPPECQVYL